MEDTGAQYYVWDYGTMGRDPIKVYVYMRNTGRKLRRAEKVRKVRQEEKSSGQPEVEWTLGALVFDLRLARRNGRRNLTDWQGPWRWIYLTNFASGFALTLREFLVGVGFAVRPGRPLRPFLFCSMQDALLDLVRPLA